MKKLLILAAVLALGSYAMADSVLFETNFDDLNLGPIVANYPSVWSYCYAQPNENNTVEVVEGGAGGNGRCLRYNLTDRYVATHTKIPNSENHSLSNDFKVSFKVNFAKPSTINFNSNDGMGELAFRGDGANAFKIAGTGTIGFSSANSCTLGTWIPVSYIINGIPSKRKLLSVQFGDTVYDNLDVTINSSTDKDWFPNFRFFPWGNADVCIDDLKIELIERDAPQGTKLGTIGAHQIFIKNNSSSLTIFNEGRKNTEISISADSDFVKLNGRTSLTNNISGCSYITIPVTVDRSTLVNDYYKTTITIRSADQVVTHPIYIQSGVEYEGFTFYKSNFENTDLGIINIVDPAWLNSNAEIIDDGDNRCMSIQGAGDLKCKVNVPDNLYKEYNFRVRCKVKCVGSGFPKLTFSSNPGQGKYELNCDSTQTIFRPINIDNPGCITNRAPIGSWFDLSYTYNTNPEHRKLLYVTFADSTYYLDVPINITDNNGYFNEFSFNVSSDGDPYLIDDLTIEAIVRPETGPKLGVGNGCQVFLSESSASFSVFNEGKGNLNFSASVTQGNDWLSIREADEETGVLEDTITSDSSKKYNVDISREKLGNTYAFGQVTVTGAEDTEIVNFFVQSGKEGEGYTFYRSDFELTDLGTINVVDSAWINDNGQVIDDNGNRCMSVQGAGQLHCLAHVPDGLYEKYNFRVSCRVKCVGEAFPQLTFGTDLSHRQGEYTLNCNGAEAIFRPVEIGDQDCITSRGPMNEWFDLSYTYNANPLNRRLLSVTFAGETFDLNKLIESTNEYGYYDEFRFYVWSSQDAYLIDDFCLDAVARQDEGPELDVGRGGQVLLAEKTATLAVLNAGSGNLSFSAEVTQGGGWLSIREADEETGVLEDVIEGSGSKKYTMDISREDLGNTYGFGQVTVTGAGDTKVVNFFVQSEDETGATLYYNEFDSMELGNIKNTDPAWIGGAEGTVVVDPITGGSCLEIIGDNQNLHAICKAPEGSSKKYNYTCSMKLKLPIGATGPYFVTGNDLGHYIGEYGISVTDNGRLKVGCSNCDNNPLQDVTAPLGEWVDFAYTYNADPLNCRLLSMTLGETTVECSEPITGSRGDYDYFNEFRFYIFGNGDHQPIYVDDFRVSMDPKDTSKPGVMDIRCEYNPIPYTKDATTINILNAGGRSFDFTAEVLQGASWLTLSAYEGTVDSSFTMTATANRGKLGYGFHRAIVKFVSSEGETKVFTIGVQAGSAEEGYVLYASDINSLKLSEITDEEVINELSEQDACFDRVTSHNCAAITLDPKDSTQKVIQMINANDWDKYCGYILNVNAPAESADDYDVVVGMKMLIPETYVNLPEEEYEHPYAAFFVSQDNSHRINELYFYLDEEGGTLNVFPELPDIQNTNWWIENVESSTPVPNNEWFTYYTRFNCKLVDYDHKRFYAFTFGENEYHLEGDDQILSYPNGIGEKVLTNEEMPTIKFWSYRDNANILLKDITVALIPHNAVPEPALLGLFALLALAFARKQR